MKYSAFIFCLFVVICFPVFAQTHVSIPPENQIYAILEQAEARGLCSPLSGVKPYTRDIVLSAINEILNSEGADKLRNSELEILERYAGRLSKPQTGLDLQRGAYYGETGIGKNDAVISMNAGAGAEIEGSAAYYNPSDRFYWGSEVWVQAYLNGDLGNNFSYGINAAGGLIKTPRNKHDGKYHTYDKDFINVEGYDYQNREIDTYGEPLTHFPYSYKKRWDGSVFFLDSLSTYDSWPNSIAGGYNLQTEITSSFLENKLLIRAGRISHEWGTVPAGSNIALNQTARPFAAVEAEFNPVSWFGIASMTGILEYYNSLGNDEGIKISAESFQNAYSVTMLQFKYKNYLFFDFIDTVVWPKRFELGYVIPIINNFLYQNNIGDFDNMAMSFNLRAQYPGLGSVWGSLFLDEVNLLRSANLDRQMFAWQAGVNVPLPILSFSSVKISYTKINPYCYTHNRNFNPWYGDMRMETSYTNNGVSLGYYLPPNSDEILVRFNTMPTAGIATSLQYQMIRHGADFGSSAVDGSSLLSELGSGRNTNPVLKRYFLQDGAYQWMHIIKLGGSWTIDKTPLSLFWEGGIVISYFTNIAAEANVTGKAHPYSVVDTDEYPKSTAFIAKIGVRLFGN